VSSISEIKMGIMVGFKAIFYRLMLLIDFGYDFLLVTKKLYLSPIWYSQYPRIVIQSCHQHWCGHWIEKSFQKNLTWNINKALLFAAQSKSPYEVIKYLVDQNCELIQYNKGNIQPIHVILSDKSQAATASEIIEVRWID